MFPQAANYSKKVWERLCFTVVSLVVTLLPMALLAVYIQKGLVIVGFSLAALAGAVSLHRKRTTIGWGRFLSSSYTKSIGAVLIVWLLSSIFGLDPETSLKKWAEYLGLTVFGFVLYSTLRDASDEDWRRFFKTVFWGALFFSAWAIMDAAYLLPRLTLLIHGPWLNASPYSTILSLLFPFLVWFAATSKQRVYWLVPFAAIVAIFACGGRSGWLSFVVVIVLCLALLPWKSIGMKTAYLAIGALASLIAGGFGLYVYKLSMGAERFQARVAPGGEYGLGTGRLDIWRFSLERSFDHPFLGIGIRNFRALDFSGVHLASTTHPHNVPLELLLETGLIGLAAIAMVLMLPVTQFFRAYNRRDGLAACCFIALAGYCTASLTLTSLFHAWWFVTGMIIFILLKSALDRLQR